MYPENQMCSRKLGELGARFIHLALLFPLALCLSVPLPVLNTHGEFAALCVFSELDANLLWPIDLKTSNHYGICDSGAAGVSVSLNTACEPSRSEGFRGVA